MRGLGVRALNWLTLAATALVGSTGFPLNAEAACSCPEVPGTVEQQVLSALEGADYVALVWIKHTDEMPTIEELKVGAWNPATQQPEIERREVSELSLVGEFTALRVFKGPDTPMWVVTSATEGGCGVSFRPGETYLIYAQQVDNELTQVSTNRCMRVVSEAESAADIAMLEEAARRKAAATRFSSGNPEFDRGLDLVHAYAGCGEYRRQDPNFVVSLSEADAIADALAKSDPLSGYSQALRAELMALWTLREGGKPEKTLQEVLVLTDEALRLNRGLALAHVTRARAFAKIYDTPQAAREIQKALNINPLLEAATLAQADIHRADGNVAKAEQWARQFIAATPEPAKRANGHDWIGGMRRDLAYHPRAANRDANLALAKTAFGMSVELDPKDPWRLINYSAFLNEHVADFAEAEKQARIALELADLPAARNQLAAARYQALQARAESMDAQSLQAAIDEIETATGLSLAKLGSVAEFREVVRIRLLRLQRSARQRSES